MIYNDYFNIIAARIDGVLPSRTESLRHEALSRDIPEMWLTGCC